MSTSSKFPVLEAYAKVRREFSRIGALELKEAEMGIKQMMILYRLLQAPCTMSELSEFSQSDKASTTRTVASLEDSGYVKRMEDAGGDRRKKVIALTAKGHKQAKVAEDVRNHIGVSLEKILTAGERKTLAALLEKVADLLAEQRTAK